MVYYGMLDTSVGDGVEPRDGLSICVSLHS